MQQSSERRGGCIPGVDVRSYTERPPDKFTVVSMATRQTRIPLGVPEAVGTEEGVLPFPFVK